MPSSMRCGSAWTVVERAYMPPSFRMASGAPAASPRVACCSPRRLLNRVVRVPSGDDVGNDVLALHGRAHVVVVDRRPRWQARSLGGEVLVGDLPEEVADHVEPGALLDVGLDHPPGGLGDVGGGEHGVLGAGEVDPAVARLEVHGAELPALGRVLEPRLEPLLLLGVAHREPVLDHLDAAADQRTLELRAEPEELLVLL